MKCGTLGTLLEMSKEEQSTVRPPVSCFDIVHGNRSMEGRRTSGSAMRPPCGAKSPLYGWPLNSSPKIHEKASPESTTRSNKPSHACIESTRFSRTRAPGILSEISGRVPGLLDGFRQMCILFGSKMRDCVVHELGIPRGCQGETFLFFIF